MTSEREMDETEEAYHRAVRLAHRKTYMDRWGRECCAYCGYELPQHAEDCDRDWTEAELREAYGR